jgi:hypothetical protein
VVEEELSRMHGGKDNEFVSVLKTEEKGIATSEIFIVIQSDPEISVFHTWSKY